MGVTGLWRLIEPAGKPVPVETLENKVLAVDISIWLHQMVKGYQDAKGAPLPNAHLMGLFQRLCKLLYFRIKPIFVFDGAYPDLKKETIAKRQDNKSKYNSESERIKRELAILLKKKTAVSSLLGKEISPKKANSSSGPAENDDLFKLPALPQREEESESESDDEQNSSGSIIDLHSVDIESDKFKNLPTKEKYDLLIELKETRKMNSWGKLHELPKKSDNFSDFQMQRLLKRRKVQECLQDTEKEMGDTGMSLNELESLLNDEGIDTKIEALPSRRIASNNTTRFLLINNVKQALADAKKRKETDDKSSTSKIEADIPIVDEKESPKTDELDDDLQKAIKMSMECVTVADTSACTSRTDESWTSCMTDTDYSNDSEEEDGFEQPDNMSTAKAYIMQYSDYTNRAIKKIVSSKTSSNKSNSKVPNVNEILDEINQEKSVIVDNVDLSSSDDDTIQDKSENKVCENIYLNAAELVKPSVDEMDITQSSVVCIGSPERDIITLDSSSEETINENKNSIMNNIEESCSSNDEFEDVPDLECKPIKPVVQLTLKMGDIPDDDIFADIFEDKEVSSTMNIEEKKIEIQTLTSTQTENIVVKHDTRTDIPQFQDDELFNDNVGGDLIEFQKSESQEKNKVMNINGNAQKVESITTEPPKSNKKDGEISVNKQKTQVNNPPRAVMTTEKLNSLVDEMENEEQDLLQQKGRFDRVGRNITEQMTKEAQELLQIFGIPYIIAPMEAEAQCAFLESVKLTDGTITDDSDIWLFGGKTVYKNFFNQKKHVMQFLADRIEKSFNLKREQLVLLALLVGSDYTTGVTGVGPVTALEILASFPFNKKQLINETTRHSQYTQILTGLQEFKRWVRSGKRTDNTTLKKKLRNVNLTDDFPSLRVVQAYLEPNVETSEDKFTWGELDITILRDYTKAKFGWSQNKLDEIIKPVIKRLSERNNQKTMQDYFKKKVDFPSLEHQLSKRVKAAVQRLEPEKAVKEQNVLEEGNKKVNKKRKQIINKTDGKSINNITKTLANAGPSGSKQKKTNEESVLSNHCVKVVSQIDSHDGKSIIDIKIPKTDRYQEIIPQREKHKEMMLQNKMKAIEIFRKTKIDPKKKTFKRKALQPKKKAELSESESD